MGRADENLRIGAPALGPLDHFFANVPFSSDVDLMITHAFARKELLGVLAIGAVTNRINVDIKHDRSQFLANLIWKFVPARQPWQKPAHRHWRPWRGTGPGYIIFHTQAPWAPCGF